MIVICFFSQELLHCQHSLWSSVSNRGTFHTSVSSVVLLELPVLICRRYPLHLQPYWWLSAKCHTPATSFKLFQHLRNLNFSHCDACLPAILAHIWSTSNGHTQLFLTQEPFARRAALLQHSSLASTWTWCWLSAQTNSQTDNLDTTSLKQL